MKKTRISLLIALCSLFMFVKVSLAQTAIERLKADYPAVMEHYAKQLEGQHADYIIAIDVSGTMNIHKNIVIPALNSFLNSLPDGDFVSFIKFGTKAEEFGLSGVINQSTRQSFQNTLSRVYDRDPAFIQRTDLGAMCDAVLAQMNRPGANNLQYVFMFTDFINEPGVGGSSWNTLQERVAAISKINIVRAMAMQLPGANTGRDIPLVRNVFPNLQTINVDNSAQLNDWFEGQKAEITKVRLMDLIRGDFDRWFSEDKIKTEFSIGLDRSLNLQYIVDGDVPAFVNGVMVYAMEPISQSNNIEKLTLAADSLYKGRDIKKEIGSIKFFNKEPLQRGVSATVSVTFRPTFIMGEKEGDPSFSNEIHRLGLEKDLTRTVEMTAESDFVAGWSLWILGLCLLLIIALVVVFIKDTVLPYKINNIRLTATGIGGKKVTYDFKRESSHFFGKKGTKLEQADFVVEVYGRRGFPVIFPRAIMFSVVEKPHTSTLTMSKNNNSISSMTSKLKVGEKIHLNQGLISFEFIINNAK